MAGMKELSGLVSELEEQLVICTRCGMCQAVCPLYNQTGKEADVARGKLALLDGLMENMFTDAKGVESRLNRCLLCGSCAANCPSGVSALEIFAKARAILAEYRGLSFAEKFIFRRLLANPSVFDQLCQWFERFQAIFTRTEKNFQDTSCARLVSPLTGGRHLKRLAPIPFHKMASPGMESAGKNTGPSVLFFTGCVIDKVFPHIALDAINVMAYHNFRVTVPRGQSCCGIPASASGDRKTFTTLVNHNLDIFLHHDFDYIVTACATCTSTIKKLWPKLYHQPNPSTKKRLADVSEKILDISQLLDSVVEEQGGAASKSETSDCVTYHDPCHLFKSLGVAAEPRHLIKASGKHLIEMQDSDQCCGMGGSFNLKHYDLSSDIGTCKAENIIATGCETIATSCPACMIQISDMLAKQNKSVYVKHPVELYAESLKKNGAISGYRI